MTDFPIKKDSYVAFDALSMKQHIKDSLTEAGVFTDQNYEGSNISTVIDLVSYFYHALIFYLNKTSTNSMFSDSQVYDCMNRIVKAIDYKPIGRQTSTLSFSMSAGAGLTPSLYTIPRYSYLTVNSIPYTFTEDITFAKTTSGSLEVLEDLSDQKLLYQGRFQEYPVYTATGDENELVYLIPGGEIIVDHFNIHVYVYNGTTWSQWEQTASLYLEDAQATKYELRFNENKNYEIKFGNGINGKKLDEGWKVAIYYLKSLGVNGEIGAHQIRGKTIVRYNSLQFDEILEDVTANEDFNFLTSFSQLHLDNESISTYSSTEESIDSIRANAPGIFRSQYRLVTTNDYESYVKTNFANLIHDVKAVNNWTYLSEHLKYYYDLGISKPTDASRVLYNQVQFADACNFNNVYLLSVPKTISNSSNPRLNLSPAQKELILSTMRSQKITTSEVVVLDPVYVAVGFCRPRESQTAVVSDVAQSKLTIIKDPNSRRDNTAIRLDVKNIFIDYFTRSNVELGQTIDISYLTASILNVDGVKTFYTQRIGSTTNRYEGLALLIWNPIYANDYSYILNNHVLPYFKFPYWNNLDYLDSYITVDTSIQIHRNVEY